MMDSMAIKMNFGIVLILLWIRGDAENENVR